MKKKAKKLTRKAKKSKKALLRSKMPHMEARNAKLAEAAYDRISRWPGEELDINSGYDLFSAYKIKKSKVRIPSQEEADKIKAKLAEQEAEANKLYQLKEQARLQAIVNALEEKLIERSLSIVAVPELTFWDKTKLFISELFLGKRG